MGADPQSGTLGAAQIALAIKRLRAQTEDLDILASEPLAIIGMGCRFPGAAQNPDLFWQMLERGTDAVGEPPIERWGKILRGDAAQLRGAYLEEIELFDAEFFGIAPREAAFIDPQHRLLLEVTWESLWDAGVVPENMTGSRAGVFVAVNNTDYARIVIRNSQMESYASVGAANCMSAGRIAHTLGVHGPTLVVDTACSSSLAAVHTAVQSLRNRECDMAIAGACNLKSLPDETQFASRWGLLAKDGRCKTFDEKADGYVPGEGCGVVVLKRLADALASGDRIHAIIRGTALNHDGRTTVLTAPSGLAQEAVIRAALQNAAADAGDVSFVEVHGTGTSLGDPIETEALQAVYGSKDKNADACFLGAVKTNVGHLEGAAGMAGLIKTVLCLAKETIPRNLHFDRLNPRMQLHDSRLTFPRQNTAWPRSGKPRFAGVSSFGLSGTNVHMIVEEAPILRREPTVFDAEQQMLLVLSAKSEPALESVALAWMQLLIKTSASFVELCAAAAKYRAHYACRMAFLGTSKEEMRHQLEAFVSGKPAAILYQSKENMETAAREYMAGKTPKWETIFPSRTPFVALPTYPWQRKRYWLEDHGAEEAAKSYRKPLSVQANLELLDQLRQLPPEARKQALLEQICIFVRGVLRLDSASPLNMHQPLQEIGLDSLMAVELRNLLQRSIQRDLNPTVVFKYPSIAGLAQYLDALLWTADHNSDATQAQEEINI